MLYKIPFCISYDDGLNLLFYKMFWYLFGQEIYSSTNTWFESATLPLQINFTSIALIPKTNNPQIIKDYHPIFLSNVIYLQNYIQNPSQSRQAFLKKCISSE